MTSRRRFVPWRVDAHELESRTLLSVSASPPATSPQLEAQGRFNLSQHSLRVIQGRLASSGLATSLVFQAFQVFSQNALGQIPLTTGPAQVKFPASTGAEGGRPSTTLPAGVTVGTKPASFALPNLVSQFKEQLSEALSTYQFSSPRPQPYQLLLPKRAPVTGAVLIPYAMEQVNAYAAGLTPNPAGGAVATPQALTSLENTYSNILNAVAEFSVHPKLFRSTSDFYANPLAHFKKSFSGIPASFPGFFAHGPGGRPVG